MGFGEDLRKIVERAKGNVSQVVRMTAVDMQTGMEKMAPVDTGRLRANFQIGVGTINKDTGATPSVDTITRAHGQLVNWRPGQPIFITNSLPYARVAEYGLYGKPPGSANGPKTRAGFSSQAVGGFVRLSVQDFQQKLHKNAMDLK